MSNFNPADLFVGIVLESTPNLGEQNCRIDVEVKDERIFMIIRADDVLVARVTLNQLAARSLSGLLHKSATLSEAVGISRQLLAGPGIVSDDQPA